ncbi:MAG: hypothetical protein PVH17_08250, partial [Anaerolineae bacterium]
MNFLDDAKFQAQPRMVRLLWILVAITIVLSLLYAIQYYVGGPLRLPVVSKIYSIDLAPNGNMIAAGAASGQVRVWDVPAEVRTGVNREFNVAGEDMWPVRTMSRLSQPVLEVGFTPDGATLIGATRGGAVRAWDPSSGAVTQEFDLGTGLLADIDLDDSRQMLTALGEDGAVRVCDVTAEQEI